MTMQLNIQDLYVEDIVKGLAKNMNALYHEEHNITKFNLPDNVGEGTVKATQFASGLGVIEANYVLKDDLVVTMEKDKINPLRFLYNLGDEVFQKYDIDDHFESIEKYRGAIIGSSIHKSHCFKLPKNKEINLFSIELNRNLFEHRLQKFNFELDEDLNKLLRDVKAIDPFFFSYAFGAEEFETIKKIKTSKKPGFIGSLHKEGLTYTILSNVLEAYLGGQIDFKKQNISDEDIQIVINISEFIEKNLGNLPTIDAIANQNIVSENKIQKLFKGYYNCSVHEFVKNKRMNQARILLETSTLSIAEISDQLGISSSSYFSKTFRQRYGVTPSVYRDSRLTEVRFY